MSVVMATFMISMIPRASVSADRIQEVLDTDSSVVPPGEPGARAASRPATLEFRGVGFHYPGAEHPVLTGISFTDRARPDHGDRREHRRGQDHAASTSSCDCSTPPRAPCWSAGSTCATSTPTCCGARSAWSRSGRTCSRARWRATCASASPTPPRKRCGRRSRSPRPPTSCARMPGGLSARIEQGGTNVSGGQRQRLSIARALVRKPDIYVFDDSFSALDLATDARLRAALEPVHRDSAVIIVAQRVSTIATADDILVLEDGVVIGRGTARRAAPRPARPTPRSCSRRSARGGGMTLIDDPQHERRQELDLLRRPETRAGRTLELGRRSRRDGRRTSRRPSGGWVGCSGRCGSAR